MIISDPVPHPTPASLSGQWSWRRKALYDDAMLFRLCDSTLSNGRIGLWTKADAVTYFDDLELRPLK